MLAAACALGSSLATHVVLAAPPTRSIDDPSNTDFIATTERNEDPLGIEDAMDDELESAADAVLEHARREAERPALTSRTGQVLSAIGAVREGRHEVQVRWAHGVERVEVRTALESHSRFAAEVSYRLPLPEGETRVLSVSLCDAHERCQQAKPTPDAAARYLERLAQVSAQPSPALTAERIVDARGPALAVRIAALPSEATLELRVEYAFEQPVRGGIVRLTVPARGLDPRTAPTHVRIEAEDLALTPDQATQELDAWLPLEVPLPYAPRDATGLAHTTRVACGRARRCERIWRARPLPEKPPTPYDLWVLVDRSPSMEGPPRGRVVPVVQALREALPEGGRLRLLVFDDRAQPLEDAPGATPEQQLREALMQPAGAKTRTSSALRTAAKWPHPRPVRVVVVTDGRLSTEAAELKAAARFRRHGLPVYWVGLEAEALDPRRAPLQQALGARFIPVASEADRALREKDLRPLRERLSPIRLGPAWGGLVPGEQHMERRVARGKAPRDPALARWLDPERPTDAWITAQAADDDGGLWPEESPRAPAPPYVAQPAPTRAADTGMPAESVLDLLRDQLIPKARACLRRDRRGRADYAVRAAFVFLLERREILDAEVQGDLQPALRRCLGDVLADLQVPRFTGRLRVRYPIYTERETEPPQIQLERDTAARLERLFEREPPP